MAASCHYKAMGAIVAVVLPCLIQVITESCRIVLVGDLFFSCGLVR
jgi:hypothetical protein